MQKAASFFAKVYDRTGATFRRVIDASAFLLVPRIVREVSKPAGEITIQLAAQWDDFGFGTTLFDGDLIKVYAVNLANPTGILVFQGHVIGIKSKYTAIESSVELRVYPIDALLSDALAFSSTSYNKTYTTQDIDTMFSGIISDCNTTHGATFFTSSLGNPGLSITYSFTRLSHLPCLQKAATFLDASWFWRISAGAEVEQIGRAHV